MIGGTIGGQAWAFGYDPENRLKSASTAGGTGTVIASYAYDPLGRRTHKSGTGVTEAYYLNDGTDEIAEYDSTGAMTRRYVPGPAIDEPILHGIEGPLMQIPRPRAISANEVSKKRRL